MCGSFSPAVDLRSSAVPSSPLAAKLFPMLAVGGLTYRRIDPVADEAFAYENYLAACTASYGNDSKAITARRYRAWLRSRVEEYPDGHVFALLDNTPVGQLELEAPYGLTTGYVTLYAVAAPFRGMGFGRLMHGYVERYFRSWDVREIELHVSPNNTAALNFYRALGYAFAKSDGRQWLMRRAV
jgi:ribosomal protein S18 acetylase RimI-like enzyme